MPRRAPRLLQDESGPSTDSPGWDPPDPSKIPGEYGIPGFRFPRPEKPPSVTGECQEDPSCLEQWHNYYLAAAAAADQWAENSSDGEQVRAELVDQSLWDDAIAVGARLEAIREEGAAPANAPSAPAPVTAQGPSSAAGDEETPPDAVPLGWLVPGESDLTQGPVADAVRLLDYLANIFGPTGTSTCPKESKPDGKLPICAK